VLRAGPARSWAGEDLGRKRTGGGPAWRLLGSGRRRSWAGSVLGSPAGIDAGGLAAVGRCWRAGPHCAGLGDARAQLEEEAGPTRAVELKRSAARGSVDLARPATWRRRRTLPRAGG
jgi:hypothetical protein